MARHRMCSSFFLFRDRFSHDLVLPCIILLENLYDYILQIRTLSAKSLSKFN